VRRLSRALGWRFTNVIGVDISRPLIEHAQRLQHMPRGLAENYIAEFTRVLRPDGLAIYAIPRTRVLRMVVCRGGRVAACVEDRAAGRNWRSFHYFVRRDR
jgi:hypothetical protein